MPKYEELDRRDRLGESDTLWLGDLNLIDPARARTTISQRDITTTDIRDDSIAEIRRKVMEGLYDPNLIPDYLWDWIGLNKWLEVKTYQIKEVNVAAEQQAKRIAQQNAARVRIRQVCCQ